MFLLLGRQHKPTTKKNNAYNSYYPEQGFGKKTYTSPPHWPSSAADVIKKLMIISKYESYKKKPVYLHSWDSSSTPTSPDDKPSMTPCTSETASVPDNGTGTGSPRSGGGGGHKTPTTRSASPSCRGRMSITPTDATTIANTLRNRNLGRTEFDRISTVTTANDRSTTFERAQSERNLNDRNSDTTANDRNSVTCPKFERAVSERCLSRPSMLPPPAFRPPPGLPAPVNIPVAAIAPVQQHQVVDNVASGQDNIHGDRSEQQMYEMLQSAMCPPNDAGSVLRSFAQWENERSTVSATVYVMAAEVALQYAGRVPRWANEFCIYDYLIKGLEMGGITNTRVITPFIKRLLSGQRISEAVKLLSAFEKHTPVRDPVILNMVLNGCVQLNMNTLAKDLLTEFKSSGDTVSYNTLLKGLSQCVHVLFRSHFRTHNIIFFERTYNLFTFHKFQILIKIIILKFVDSIINIRPIFETKNKFNSPPKEQCKRRSTSSAR